MKYPSNIIANCGNSLAIASEITSLSLSPRESKNAESHGLPHAEIVVNDGSRKRTKLCRSEKCNIRLEEMCYQRGCKHIVILANQESIPIG